MYFLVHRSQASGLYAGWSSGMSAHTMADVQNKYLARDHHTEQKAQAATQELNRARAWMKRQERDPVRNCRHFH